MPIHPDKQHQLIERMNALQLLEKDLIEKFVLSSGPGGQKVNKTASCVYLKHLPSGIEVKCDENRSRDINRFLARRKLCDHIEKAIFGRKTAQDKKIDKIRKQKKRRIRRHEKKE